MTEVTAYMNETVNPSAPSAAGNGWVTEYVLARQGYFGVPAGNDAAARAFADRDRPLPGTAEFQSLVDAVKANFFQKTPVGTWTDNGISKKYSRSG